MPTAGTALEGTATLSAADLQPMSDPDFSFTSASGSRRGFWWLVALGLVVVMAVVCATTFVVAWNRGLTQAQQAAGGRVDRYAANLKSTLDRYEYLPALVALHPFIHDLLANPTPANVDRANRYLREVNDRAHATATYVIAPSGKALAASNYNQPDSFVAPNICSGRISSRQRKATSGASTVLALRVKSPAITSPSRSCRMAA